MGKTKILCGFPYYKAQICDALHDFVPFVQFKKCEKHPWRSVNFSIFQRNLMSVLKKIEMLQKHSENLGVK